MDAKTSLYGSHNSMIIRKFHDFCYCVDEQGIYQTTYDKVDSGLADINRYGNRVNV